MKKITIIFMSVLMIFASCSTDIPYEDINENTKTVEEPKEDDTENNTEESSNEDDSENGDVENKTWCEIGEDIKILELNYFVCVDNSQTKLSPSINDESQAKKDTFYIRDYVDCVSKYIEIRVGYNNKKLNFSSVNDTYTIVDITMEDSNVNITIEWK